MAKAAYKPAQMLKEDPLAALKTATNARPEAKSEPESVGVETLPANIPTPAPAAAQSIAAPVERVVAPPARTGSIAPIKPLARVVNPGRSTFYLYPEDLTRLRQLSGYISTQHGIRANDSVIVRAALSLAEPDVRFMHAIEEAMQADRRKDK